MSAILLTGAGGGIAAPLIERLAVAGRRLILIDRSQAVLEPIAEKALKAGADVVTIVSQLETAETCRDIVASAGPLTALVHLAGVFEPDPEGPGDMGIWERAINNNLTNAYTLGGFAAEAMLADGVKDGAGRLVFISSLAFNRGSWEHVPYASAKGGLVGLTRALSRRYAPNILVNALAPGIIDTAMPAKIIAERGDRVVSEIPLRRIGRPEEVAGVIHFLLSDDSSYVTGQLINVDGGIINS